MSTLMLRFLTLLLVFGFSYEQVLADNQRPAVGERKAAATTTPTTTPQDFTTLRCQDKLCEKANPPAPDQAAGRPQL
jgi:hypothetical protein